jgi:hypothetical protein
MNMMFFNTGKEREICQEIMAWSDHTLQKPNPYYNGLPPCPYAKKAWEEQKVAILFKYEDSFQALYSTISQWEDELDLVIIVDLAFEKDPDRFHHFLDGLNGAISDGIFLDRDIWVMGFHPHDEANDFIDDQSFMQMVDDEYAMVFVQRLSKVQESADKLAEKGYYDNYLEEYDAEEIFHKRAELYRRLKNGDETT